MAGESLHRWLVMARLLALLAGKDKVEKDDIEEAVSLDRERQRRVNEVMKKPEIS